MCVFQLVFEALHSQEPRGYVVGWIIAISLLVGILIFLLLAVLLWKVNTRTQDCDLTKLYCAEASTVNKRELSQACVSDSG